MTKTKIIVCMAFMTVLMAFVAIAQPVGYEYLDNNTKLHLWNNATGIKDYYMHNDCLGSLSNVYNETWETITYRVGFQRPNDNIIYGLPFENCTRKTESDNHTFVWARAVHDIYEGKYKLKYGLLNNLSVNASRINQTYGFKLNDTFDRDVWFSLKSSDLNIANTTENNFLHLINKSKPNQTVSFNLSLIDELDLILWFDSSDFYSVYWIEDIVEKEHIIREWYNSTFEWRLRVGSAGNINLLVNLGSWTTANELKTFNMLWVDAGCTCSCPPFQSCVIYTPSGFPDGLNHTVGQSFNHTCYAVVSNGACTGCALNYRTNQYSQFGELVHTSYNSNSSDYLECDSGFTTCLQRISNYWPTVPYIKSVTHECKVEGTAFLDCIHDNVPSFTELPVTGATFVCNDSAIVFTSIDLLKDDDVLDVTAVIAFILIFGGGLLIFWLQKRRQKDDRDNREM